METGIDYGEFESGRHVNYWELDRTLQRELRRVTDTETFEWAEPRLAEFGELIGHTVADNADYVDDHGPELETYDEYGDVQNFVRYPAEQLANEAAVYEAGIVADAFEAPPGRDEPVPFSQYLATLQLLCYADAGFGCPVAMTAGSALVLERFDDGELEPYYRGLVSRDYDGLIEGAMFLTEEQGGSDVGANETTARYDEAADCWRLTGEKWFCSNVDAEGTLALARTEDAPAGTDGLSMFLVPHGDPDEGVMTKGDRRAFEGAPPGDALNDQLYRRLKDKLGTTAVPTGEVEFEDTKAYLVGEQEAGFKQMTEMLNLERLSNAAASCGIMGRALLESRVKAANREAFGKPIEEFPLMREDLVDMTVDYEAATAYVHEVGRLFSERERARRTDESSDELEDTYRLLRLLIPIAKLRTGRMAVDTASYAMEIQGGNGYVDDFVTNRLLRDAQVLPIWEGTENILSLDVVRALEREDAHEPFMRAVEDRLEAVDHPALADAAETVETAYEELLGALAELAEADGEYAQLSAKRLSHYVFEVFTAALLLAEAQSDLEDGNGRTAMVARRFVTTELAERDGRGITGGDRFVLEAFEPIVHHAPVDPETVSETVTADD
ncbi:acyl-CoA dehydrogenase family protein [Natrinema longum]|uniref:Acyl-CoA dehydrogenase family protein n=1 Tax=Natrinema longum TaxID=370324 RepID=A0A8A2UDJ2_9EURY|nr:acyl-CoA dehydrogenase family protein [Natrinema longum]MBZ6495324.1 acyl-CoA dehydrogenase family protein [Natrinema longum]QSW86703.1 acyl-CoA dehydrogenase family protein [Natrinema longum]